MPTIAQYLQGFLNSKEAIRSSIINKGVVCNTSVLLSDYASKIDSISSGGSSVPSWNRPSDWLALPTLNSGDQKFVGLFAVWNNNENYVALTAEGNYQVDWGDGSSDTVTSGSTAEHQYVYSTLSSVVSSRGYKMAVVTITPQSGQNLTFVSLDKIHGTSNPRSTYTSWLDVSVNSPYLTRILFSVWDSVVDFNYLEQVKIAQNNIQDLSFCFKDCSSLKNVEIGDTHLATNMAFMFYGCTQLTKIPLFDTSSVTNMYRAFKDCYSLVELPLLDMSSATNMDECFNDCYSLKSVPLFNTSNVTSMNGTFNNCVSLDSFPSLDTSKVTNFSNILGGCYSLKEVSQLDFSSGITADNAFSNCRSLTTVPSFNFGTVTDIHSLFINCDSLSHLPLFVVDNVTNMSHLVEYGYNFTSIPSWNVQSVTNFDSMFNNCNALTECLMESINASISFQNCNLSADALNKIYGNLSNSSGLTITITGNYGASTSNTSIATSKGWTVSN